ncbi:MAG: 6,7-dimethyl-8-ribityllumazine synthase [Paludibacteraceae bacterium]|nr:6,7-dimethyl-8-ribityllumazine synthase [Paludibacteraceae bacterium]
MASKLQNLSSYNPDVLPAKHIVAGQKYGVVVADWNSQVTFKLLEGAVSALEDNGAVDITVTHVPGTFELTYAAKKLMQTGKYSAIIVLGCVIQGDTPHFDYVCGGVTQGITALNLEKDGCPVIFGVLTTLNLEQALDRAGGKLGNKGVEGAITAIRMANMR